MKKILIVEGNLREENKSFSENGIQTHTESLKDSLSHFTDDLSFDVVNPSSDQNIQLISDQLCLLYTSPSPRDRTRSRMPSSA